MTFYEWLADKLGINPEYVQLPDNHDGRSRQCPKCGGVEIFTEEHWTAGSSVLGANVDDQRLYQRTDDLRRVLEEMITPILRREVKK